MFIIKIKEADRNFQNNRYLTDDVYTIDIFMKEVNSLIDLSNIIRQSNNPRNYEI